MAPQKGLPTPLDIQSSLFAENRQRLKAALNNEGVKEHAFVFLEGGKERNRYNSDTVDGDSLVFRQESYFYWCFGVVEPDFYGAIDLDSGESYLFMPNLPESYAVWFGTIFGQKYFQQKYDVDAVFYNDDIVEELQNRNAEKILLLCGTNTDSHIILKSHMKETLKCFNIDEETLYPIITECRVFKSDKELEVLRYVCGVATNAQIEVMRNCQPDIYEFHLESIFRYEIYFNGGCRNLAFSCICASGPNSAILHYGHAGKPNDRKIEDGDMVVSDMGAEYKCFASDITTSFPANGRYSEKQKIIYSAVLDANRSVQETMKPGVCWVDMHLLAQRKILEHLTRAGILQGDIEEMMEANLAAIFMPHGLGHFMGLDVHDVGGYPTGTERIQKPSLGSLRTTRILQPRMVITVEPGCYFIESELNKALKDGQLSKFLVPSMIEEYRHFGGVRIEDDVVVTEDGCELLTPVPREISEIESLMTKNSRL